MPFVFSIPGHGQDGGLGTGCRRGWGGVEGLSKRELIRRLGTSATQFYRLLDQTNYKKSFGQLLSLLHVLDCDVDLVVKEKVPKSA